uniref:cysteine dioxygenase n=1 Tax=Oryza sativa subsp. japonica TaxID=39947 RepID=Q6EPF7_ORYSJ|nr:HGWP repeat containing protein-like [Oryza sativa Japonica Group]
MPGGFTNRLAFTVTDWCFRLYGWRTSPLSMGIIIVFTDWLPHLPPTGVLAYMAGWSHHHCWHQHLHRPAASFIAPTGVFAYTVGWSHHRCLASTSSPTGCLVRRRLVSSPIRLVGHTIVHGRPRLHRPAGLHRRRLVFPPARLAYYAAVVGRLRLHRRPASIAADWCPRLYGWLVTPLFMGVHVFTDWLAFAAADWCFRLHGWPIMPPLLGVYDFTSGLPPSPPTGVLAYTVGWSHHRSWESTSSPTGLPLPPPTGVSAYTAGLLCRRWWASSLSPSTAFVAVDWCLHCC